MEEGEKQKVARKVLMQLAQKLDYMMITDTQTYSKMKYYKWKKSGHTAEPANCPRLSQNPNIVIMA